MNSKKSITYLLIIILLLVICSATSIGYIIGISNSDTPPQYSPVAIADENQSITDEINDLKSVYNSKIAEKTATYNELEIERNKVNNLLIELENAKGDANSLLKYKEQYQNLEGKMRFLVDEIEALKGNKIKAVSKAIASKKTRRTKKEVVKIIPTSNSKSETAVLIKNEEIPEKKIEKTPSDIRITNLEAAGYIKKSSDKIEKTQLARKVDLIRVSFAVTGNPNVINEDKKYYIQIINSQNNVLGTKTTEYIDGFTLTYSTQKVIKFEGKEIQVVYDLTSNKFEKGDYYITVFDRSKLVSKNQIYLD